MSDEEFAKQLEFYSNAITAYFPLQGLAFAYEFKKSLAGLDLELYVVLTVALLGVMAGGVLFTRALGRTLQTVSSDAQKAVLGKIYRAKMVIIVLFGVLPLALTLRYGVIPHATGRHTAVPALAEPRTGR